MKALLLTLAFTLLALPACAQRVAPVELPTAAAPVELPELLTLERESGLKDWRILALQLTVWRREQLAEELRINAWAAAFEAKVEAETGKEGYDVWTGQFVEDEESEP